MKHHENYKTVTQRQEESKGCWKNSTDRLAWCRVAPNLYSVKKKIKQYLQSTIEQGLHIVHTVRPTQPDGSHKTCSLVLLNPSTQPWFDKWSCTPISSFPICDQINNFSLSYEIHLLIIPHSMCDLSSSTRDQTHTHLLGRWSLYQWTAGEVPIHTFLIGVTSWLNQIIVLKC